MYYVVVNDLVGGYDISEYDKPVSEHGEDEATIAWGLTEEWAKKIVSLLNDDEGEA